MNKQTFFATAIIILATLFSSNNLSAQWSQSATAIYPTTLTKNVGIGMNSPTSAKMQFDNTLGNKITLFDNGNNVAYGLGINGSNGGNLSAYIPAAAGSHFSIRTNNYNGTEKFVVTSDGNVGIGMNAPTSAKMQFDNTLGNKITLFDNGNNVAYGFGINGSNGGNLSAYIPAAAGSHFSIRTNNYDGAEKFVVTSDGNVGIGTTAPNAKLEVNASNGIAIGFGDGGTGEGIGSKRTSGGNQYGLDFYTSSSGVNRMSITNAGKVGIGISDPASMPGNYKLYVADGILTEKVKVALKSTANWADYVFADNYKLRSLSEVEQYVQENKHLPGVPSAEEVQKTGIDMATMDAKLLEKIEELTLYMIDMKKENTEMKQANEALKARISTLESKK